MSFTYEDDVMAEVMEKTRDVTNTEVEENTRLSDFSVIHETSSEDRTSCKNQSHKGTAVDKNNTSEDKVTGQLSHNDKEIIGKAEKDKFSEDIFGKLTQEELSQCYFMPKKSIKQAMSFLNSTTDKYMTQRTCRNTIIDKQMSKYIIQSRFNSGVQKNFHWRTRYIAAINRAIYSHDWNKLLYILKKSPIEEHFNKPSEYHYIRALTILLMNHPSAKSQSLLNHYLHMVLSCRSDQDKKALYKLLLTMPEKLIRPFAYSTYLGEDKRNEKVDVSEHVKKI